MNVREILTQRVAENWAVADAYRKAFFNTDLESRPTIGDINDAFSRWRESVEILELLSK